MDIQVKLTAAQCGQLEALRVAGAWGRDSAVNVHQVRLNPVVIGKLHDLSLADSRVGRSAGGGQCTYYWLTAEGRVTADRLKTGAGQ